MLLDTKLLRQKVLDLAIRGQLVPQLDSESAVEQLGKVPEDVPFEIPEKWKWVSLRDVGIIISGGTPKTSETSYWGNDVSWITPADLGKLTEPTIYSGARSISYAGLKNSSARLIPEGSVVYSSRAPIGHIAIAGKELTTNQGCKSLYPNTTVLSSKWTYFTLIARTKDIQQRASGTTFKEISAKGFAATLIPLPPLEEQKRIVAKVEEIFAELDAIDKSYSELEQLGNLSKSKILDLAIKGQLVPQLDSEPAVEQLGKAPEDVPFEIPEKWKWVEVNKVCTISPKVSANDDQQVSFIPMSHVSGGYNNKIATEEIKSWGSVKQGFSRFEERDVLLAKITPCFENMKSCIASNLFNKVGAGSTELITLRSGSNIYSPFLLYFLKSDYLINYGIQNFNGTAGQKRFSTTALKVCPFPLPPLEEQKRIVAKVEELFALIDAMKK